MWRVPAIFTYGVISSEYLPSGGKLQSVALVPILCKISVLPHDHSGVHSRFVKFRASFLSRGDP